MSSRITPDVIRVVKATAGVVAPNAEKITKTFYGKMFRNRELFAFFNKANQKRGEQPFALATAVVAFASNIDNLGALAKDVPLMVHKHCALQVQPDQYHIVHSNLMEAVGEVLGGAVTPDVAHAWSEAVLGLAQILIDAEKQLYDEAAARRGGWRGWRDFVVASKTKPQDDVALFTFKPVDGKKDGFEFQPGQYLTVNVNSRDAEGDIVAPRHYTVTSPVGSDALSIAVRRVEGGVVSGILHDRINEGDVVKLSPPFGVFTSEMVERDASVFVSAGIGITPIYALVNAIEPSRVHRALHVDYFAERNPFHEQMQARLGSKYSHWASGETSSTRMEKIVDSADVSGRHVYLCGPQRFIQDFVVAARKAGALSINYERFGPRHDVK